MKYEYDYEMIVLTDEQRHMVELGLAKVEDINAMIKEIVNERATDGWEPLYPFSVPQIWFRKPKTTTRKRKTTKKA